MTARLTWVGWNEFTRDAKHRYVRVDEDHFPLAAFVEELEECVKGWIARVNALVVG